MIADIALLTSIRWQMSWNTFRRQSWMRKVSLIIGLLWLGVFLASFSALVGFGIGKIAADLQMPGQGNQSLNLTTIGAEIEPLLPGLLLTGVFILLIASSFGIALGSLYLSSDLDVLMVAPINRKAVFTAKLLDGLGWHYGLLLVAGAPALFVLGMIRQYNFLYYPLTLLTLLGSPLLPAGIGALAVMLIARFAPARRVREILGLIAALFSLTCALASQASRIWVPSLRQLNTNQANLAHTLDQLTHIPLPTLFAGQGLVAAGHGQLQMALVDLVGYLFLTFGVFGGCVWLADRLYFTGWARMQGSGDPKRSQARAQAAARSTGLSWGPVEFALARKDWRVIPRDLRNFAQLLAPLLILPFVYLNMLTTITREPRAATQVAGWTTSLGPLANAGFVAVIASSSVLVFRRIAMTGISMEGRSWWLIKVAPIQPGQIWRGKFLAAFVPYSGLSTALLLGVAAVRRFSPFGTLYGWYGMELVGAGILALSVTSGAIWAKLDWQDPRRMVSGIGALVSFVVDIGYGLVSGLALLLPVGLSLLFPHLTIFWWLCGVLLPLGLTVIVVILAYQVATAQLRKVGES